MGIVINPRGTAGSGKTTFARRILAAYGWPAGAGVQTLHRDGRDRPIAYRLAHPRGGRPLVVLGEYRGVRGGCDTIGRCDGGLPGALGLAADLSAGGHDVLLEGLVLSAEHRLSAAFARARPLHVLNLATSVDASARALAARRRAGPGSLPALVRKVTAEHAAVAAACARLAAVARVESLPFDAALQRALALLGLPGVRTVD
ncbi:hypothetical protein [Azospirillum sp. A39]|uniref:hypothetical protein n=1 Tax=Azospirillum sp. A39 TaxID=3462279 RepID=UPI00404569C0